MHGPDNVWWLLAAGVPTFNQVILGLMMIRLPIPKSQPVGGQMMSFRFIGLACLLGIGYWLIESFAHVYLFRLNEQLSTALFHPSPMELWMRFTVIFILIMFGVYVQVSSNNRSRIEEEIRASRSQLRKLTSHLQVAREEERRHIAREIHDELGQKLSALHLDLSWMRTQIPKNESRLQPKISAVIELVNNISGTVDKISTSLRPAILDDLGLNAALEWQVGVFKELSGLSCTLDMPSGDLEPAQGAAIVIFRVLQESLTNIMRHARASQVAIMLTEANDWITLSIRDDGIGITNRQRTGSDSFGLVGMHERIQALGGRFEITGSPGVGTKVTAVIPKSNEGLIHDRDPTG